MIARAGTVKDVATVVALVAEYAITDVVVGMPYELSGRVGFRGKRVGELIAALRVALDPGIAMHEVDERFTTAEAQRVLIEADVSRSNRKRVIDQQAATLILQTWLDTRKHR